jgi:hypothetical protein
VEGKKKVFQRKLKKEDNFLNMEVTLHLKISFLLSRDWNIWNTIWTQTVVELKVIPVLDVCTWRVRFTVIFKA